MVNGMVVRAFSWQLFISCFQFVFDHVQRGRGKNRGTTNNSSSVNNTSESNDISSGASGTGGRYVRYGEEGSGGDGGVDVFEMENPLLNENSLGISNNDGRGLGEGESDENCEDEDGKMVKMVPATVDIAIYSAELGIPDPECSICYLEYQDGDELVRLNCLHIYHRECIKRWLGQKRECALCRREVVCDNVPVAVPVSSSSLDAPATARERETHDYLSLETPLPYPDHSIPSSPLGPILPHLATTSNIQLREGEQREREAEEERESMGEGMMQLGTDLSMARISAH